MDVTKLSLLEAAELLRAGKVTSTELTKACLAAIEKNKHLNLFNNVFAEQALQQAAEADSLFKQGKELPLLAGIPISIKDNMNYIGTPTPCGSNFLRNYISPYNATLVENLLKNHAVILGKTNMDEFAMGSSSETCAFGTPLNPHNSSYVCGGSSGGAAGAVAANLCFASIGSDTGGSIRQPSSFCGVVGLKPTYGTVSRYGIAPMASSLDQAGPITKTVKDAAAVLQALQSYDLRESTSIKCPEENYSKDITANIKNLRVGIIKETTAHKIDADVQKTFENAVSFFKANCKSVTEFSMPNIGHSLAVYYIISGAEAASNLSRLDGIVYGARENAKNIEDLYYKNRKIFGTEVKRRIMLGNYVLCSGYYDAYYKKAKAVQKLIIQQFAEVFKNCDVIICPTTTGTAFKPGEISDSLTMYLNDIFTVPANIAGLPAISVPAGVAKNNMPIGLQFIAPKLKESTMFNASFAFEQSMKEGK